MKITLYANKKLNNDYYQVFGNLEAFNSYLNSVDKIEFDVDDVYTPFSGSINLDITLPFNIFYMNYNYIKIENNSLINISPLYAFVSSIELINENLRCDYNIDYWSTFYIPNELNIGLISRCSNLDIANFESIEQPYSYMLNNGFITERIILDDGDILNNRTLNSYWFNNLISEEYRYSLRNNNDAILCFAELQIFDLDRGTEELIVNKNFQNVTLFIGMGIPQNLDDLYNLVNSLFANQSAVGGIQSVYIDAENNQIYKRSSYSVSSIYFLPYSFGILKNVNFTKLNIISNPTNPPQTDIFNSVYTLIIDDSLTNFQFYTCYNERVIKPYIIKNNFKNIAIQYGDNFIPIKSNGKDLKIYISWIMSDFGFNISLEIENDVILLNEMFKLDLNYTPSTAEQNAQQRIAHNVKTINGVIKLGTGLADIAISSTLGVKGLQPSKGKGNAKWKHARSKANLSQEIIGESSGIIGGVVDLFEANAPKYQDVNSKEGVISSFIFALGGFNIARIYNPPNENEVNDAIRETGYKVNKIISGQIPTDSEYGTYFIKFDFVNLTTYSTEIQDAISSILLNGVKIINNV